MKPKIQIYHNSPSPDYKWICHNNLNVIGYGKTPDMAYAHWFVRHNTITRIPRKGVWNKRDTMAWWSRGCPYSNTFIQLKHLVAYDPSTDELILRG